MNLKNRQLFSIFATLVIIFLIFRKGNFNDLYDVLTKINVLYLVLALFSYTFFSTLIGFRFHFLIENQISFFRVLKCHFGSMLLSDVTPGRLGYFTIVHHLKDDIDVEKSTNYVLLGQLNDFANKLFSIIVFSYLLGSALIDENTMKFVSVFTIFCLFLLFALTYGIGMDFIFAKIKSTNKVFIFLNKIRNHAIYDISKLLKFISITTFAWFFLGLFWYFSALSLGIDNFTIFYHMILQGLASVLSFLPFLIGGIGLQEATLVTILNMEGIDYDLVLGFVILTRGLNITLDFLLGIRYIWGSK